MDSREFSGPFPMHNLNSKRYDGRTILVWATGLTPDDGGFELAQWAGDEFAITDHGGTVACECYWELPTYEAGSMKPKHVGELVRI